MFAIIPKCLLYTYTWPGPYLIILLVDIETRLQGNMYDVVRGVLPHPLIWMISHALRTLHKYRVLEAH